MFQRMLLGLVLLCTACSSSTVILAPKEQQLPLRGHFVPLVFETEVTREHQAAIERIVLASLRNRGYFLSAGNQITTGVPRVQTTIKSVRRDSILLGHVNSISGGIKFFDANGVLLAESEHTERERGGVLFNSGQVLKGLVNEVEHLRGSDFENWISRFAQSLVQTFPKATGVVEDPDLALPTLRNVQLTSGVRGEQICLESGIGNKAFLRIRGLEYPLRDPVGNGRYCLLLPATMLSAQTVPAAKLFVESPFGLRNSQTVALKSTHVNCPTVTVASRTMGNTSSFSVRCGERPCNQSDACERFRFRVYQSEGDGAFVLAQELSLAELRKSFAEKEGLDVGQKDFRLFLFDRDSKIQQPLTVSVVADNAGQP